MFFTSELVRLFFTVISLLHIFSSLSAMVADIFISDIVASSSSSV